MQTKDKILTNKQGDEPILSAPPKDWSVYLTTNAIASDGFMDGVEDLPIDEKDSLEASS
jgi:hypothetical protein